MWTCWGKKNQKQMWQLYNNTSNNSSKGCRKKFKETYLPHSYPFIVINQSKRKAKNRGKKAQPLKRPQFLSFANSCQYRSCIHPKSCLCVWFWTYLMMYVLSCLPSSHPTPPGLLRHLWSCHCSRVRMLPWPRPFQPHHPRHQGSVGDSDLC